MKAPLKKTAVAGQGSNTKTRFGPSGIHVFSRSSGQHLLIDEIVPRASLWAAAPRQVSIALTNACDLSCPYCSAPKTNARLQFEQVTSWLHEFDDNGTLGVGFGGGEPTLYRRFAELCAYAASNTGLAVTFTTHGHHLDDALLSQLDGHVHFVRVSMDGVGRTYERLRGRSFSVIKSRLGGISKISFFGINYVVNSDTFPDIDIAAELAEDAGASEFLLLPEQPVGNRSGIDILTSQQLQEWVSRYSGKMTLTVSERGSEGLDTCDPFVGESELRSYAHINAHGVLKATSYEGEGVFIGTEGVLGALGDLSNKLKTTQ